MYSNFLIVFFMHTMNIVDIIVLINICTLILVHCFTETSDEVFCELSMVNHSLFTFTSLLMKEAPLTFSSLLKTRVWSNLSSLHYVFNNKFYGIEYLLVFNIFCCNDWRTNTYLIFLSLTIILEFGGCIFLVVHESVNYNIWY